MNAVHSTFYQVEKAQIRIRYVPPSKRPLHQQRVENKSGKENVFWRQTVWPRLNRSERFGFFSEGRNQKSTFTLEKDYEWLRWWYHLIVKQFISLLNTPGFNSWNCLECIEKILGLKGQAARGRYIFLKHNRFLTKDYMESVLTSAFHYFHVGKSLKNVVKALKFGVKVEKLK